MADPNDISGYQYFPQGDPGGYGANQQPALPTFTDALGNAFGGAFNNIRGGLGSLGGILSGLVQHPPMVTPTGSYGGGAVAPPPAAPAPSPYVPSPLGNGAAAAPVAPPSAPTPAPPPVARTPYTPLPTFHGGGTSQAQPTTPVSPNAPTQSTPSPATSAGGGDAGYSPSFGSDFQPTAPATSAGGGGYPSVGGYPASFGPGFHPGAAPASKWPYGGAPWPSGGGSYRGPAPGRVAPTHVAQHPATSRFNQARAQAPAARPPVGPANDPNVIRWMPAGGRGGSSQQVTALPSSGNVVQRLFNR